MRISAALPTGTIALLFESARRRRELEGRIAGALQDGGYSEVVLPILDYLEPYEELLTEASRAELYRFVDRDGELLALRADFTPMLARLLAPRLPSLELPLRLFYRGDVVRYQEERAGRQREYYQVGAELLGVEGEPAAREVLRLFLASLALGEARPLRVVLGFAGALDRLLLAAAERITPSLPRPLSHPQGGRGAPPPARNDPFTASNRGQSAAALAAAIARRERHLDGPYAATLRRLVETGLPADPADLGERSAAHLATLTAIRDELAAEFPEIGLTVDLAEFAHQSLDEALLADLGGRAYYDGILFRAYAGDRGLPVGAGGRYDRLFRALGTPVPAIGFSLDLERLMNGHAGHEDGAPAAGEARR